MNWLDFVLLAAIVLGALYGLKVGLIKAVFVTVAVYIGWLLAGQWSDDIGGLFEQSLSNETMVTVISYAIIIIGSLIVTNYVVNIVKPLLTVFTLGLSSLVDRVGGLVLGLLLGMAVSGALIIGFARLTYNFETISITDVVPGQFVQIGDQLAKVEDVRESLETALTESQLVSTFIDIADRLPGDAMGYIPSDFKLALNILKKNIE